MQYKEENNIDERPTYQYLVAPAFASPHFSQDGVVIAQDFGFTGDFQNEWNNSVYCRVQKMTCRFKEQARIRHSCEKCGLGSNMVKGNRLV